jgi:hypothetical protein
MSQTMIFCERASQGAEDIAKPWKMMMSAHASCGRSWSGVPTADTSNRGWVRLAELVDTSRTSCSSDRCSEMAQARMAGPAIFAASGSPVMTTIRRRVANRSAMPKMSTSRPCASRYRGSGKAGSIACRNSGASSRSLRVRLACSRSRSAHRPSTSEAASAMARTPAIVTLGTVISPTSSPPGERLRSNAPGSMSPRSTARVTASSSAGGRVRARASAP